jgi:hypothetical protein
MSTFSAENVLNTFDCLFSRTCADSSTQLVWAIGSFGDHFRSRSSFAVVRSWLGVWRHFAERPA